jgi:hypothetical protein
MGRRIDCQTQVTGNERVLDVKGLVHVKMSRLEEDAFKT